MKRSTRFLIPAIAAITTVSATAQQGMAPFQIAENGQTFTRLADAIEAVGDGQATIMIAPGTYRECAVQSAGHISFKAEIAGRSIFDGGICEGKAALVLRGRSAAVDGLIFQNMAVPDGNGAGIRLEKGNLAVTRSVFRNSEEGILTAQDPAGEIVIDQTTFSELGRCDRGLSCAHSIYIGDFASLTVTRSRFERGNGGHYIKSRAATAIIQNNAFDDTRGQATNYMIDLPGGATGMISGNVFVQGKDKENYSAFIAVAAEGRQRSSAGLAISGNDASLATGVDRNTVFLADWSGDAIVLGANRLGRGLKPFEKR
ncbi:right-handed parallel beta-helix repeat-containing protein [uncultured Sphingorhabdus sp.]|uniref:right-handed parallel beta-helix repeat-containing protein n=1 Tax=uncultured Sphingorhabdus sp. TaxID=1686106 RepID=UPI00261AD45D|nr:right-handed parallel beta-helix repeat-containing protein [uncultured Sphingorhabdus sp.]HMS19194.1 right-handed parallel beta-helix repeat-containing protein [Sphingorhabdus sp.]